MVPLHVIPGVSSQTAHRLAIYACHYNRKVIELLAPGSRNQHEADYGQKKCEKRSKIEMSPRWVTEEVEFSNFFLQDLKSLGAAAENILKKVQDQLGANKESNK